jgi:hypothetical protein
MASRLGIIQIMFLRVSHGRFMPEAQPSLHDTRQRSSDYFSLSVIQSISNLIQVSESSSVSSVRMTPARSAEQVSWVCLCDFCLHARSAPDSL